MSTGSSLYLQLIVRIHLKIHDIISMGETQLSRAKGRTSRKLGARAPVASR